MLINFTFDEFLKMIESYNDSMWPLHLFFYALGITAILFVVIKKKYSGKIITGILALFWIWNGIVFNWMFFSAIFPMAILFAVLFVVEGIILAEAGALRGSLSFTVKADIPGIAGVILIVYGLVAYPLIEYLLGRGYPQLLPFGLAPCPTTIFTLGILLWSDKRLPGYLLVIPVMYALSGVIPVSLGVVEDIGLIIAGLVTTFFFLHRNPRCRFLINGNKVVL